MEEYLHIWGNGPHKVALLTPYLMPAALYHTLAAPLFADFTCYVPDYPGYGSARQVAGPYDIPRYAQWAADLLRPHGPMPVMGYSMGGIVAQLLAVQDPALVSRLMLALTYAYKPQSLVERGQALAFVPLIKRLGPRGLARVMYAELTNVLRTKPRDAMLLKPLVENNRPDVMVDNARSLLKIDNRSLLPRILQPTTVIAGGADWVVPSHHARQLAGSIPQAQLHTIPGAGHFAIYSHAAAFWPMVAAFARGEARVG